MCDLHFLSNQLQHGAELALLVAAVGVVALALDLFGKLLERAGASPETICLIRFAGGSLLALDLLVVLAIALVQVMHVFKCLL